MPHESWATPIATVLSVATDQSVFDAIKSGYTSDEYCTKLAKSNMSGAKCVNGLWYVGNCLLIPHVGDIHENLFRLTHDSLGHFGTDKSYAMLHDAYYWLNMCHDLHSVLPRLPMK